MASLSQERYAIVSCSDKTAPELAKLIRATLLPEGHQALNQVGDDGQALDVLPVPVLQNAIQSIAQRVNYGIDAPSETTILPSLQLWRWEVNDLSLLPKENLDKLIARRDERVQAKQQAAEQFQALPEETRQAFLEGKKVTKAKESESYTPLESETDASNPPAAPAPSVTPAPKEKEKSERTKLRESRKAERQAKEQKVEKNKQAQARLFNSFFQQPTTRSPAKQKEEEKNDFQRTFLPCEYKNMAEINQFYRPMDDTLLEHIDKRTQSPADLMKEFKQMGKPRKMQPRGIHPAVSVRAIMKCVQESDVLGGNAEEHTKHELEKLNNRHMLPIKLLQFQSDQRPGWIGTWSRASTFITPRKPFGQDPVALDYTYDSDAEWEEGEEGENVDAMDDREDEESLGASDNDDSEMDDWLEDDLEVIEEAPPAEAEYKIPSSPLNGKQAEKPVNVLQPKKKIKLLGRRFDSKLVPYITGPHWEQTFGQSEHESFAPYRIQFFNDASPGLDPFTFSSATVSIAQPAEEKPMTAPPSEQTQAPQATASTATPASIRTTKFNFPDTHLPELLNMIQGSTRSKPALVEDLREHFGPIVKGVSKAAIETRLQECAMRESKKPGSKWIIKSEWQSHLNSSTAP